MAELTKKLHFKKNTTEHMAKAYSTTAEAGAEYITNKIDGVTAYVPIGATNDSRATMGRVTKNGPKSILTMGKPPYKKIEWTTPGTYTFTVPAGVTTIRITMSGGGGGGGAGAGSALRGSAGGGGGAGGYIKNYVMNVDSNSTIAIVVGAGGIVAPAAMATASKVGSIFANGGGAGEQGGSGGNAGIGGKGGSSTTGSLGADGENGVSKIGGKGGTSGDGTPGGAGGTTAQNGTAGSRGSGGGGSGAGAGKIGGNGGNGFVIIEYGGDI